MSIRQNTLDLWRRAAPFRFLVIGATVFTALALFSGRGGGGSGSGAPPAPVQTAATSPGAATAPAASAPAASGASRAAAGSCGPQGQLALQAPIVVSATGQTPSNVSMPAATQPGGMPPQVQSRFTQFVTRVDAANLEQRMGERCVRMDGALGLLASDDYPYADCFQDGERKLVLAQTCATDLAASETRFERLLSAYGERTADRSAARTEELALSRQRMTDFDRTREKWALNDRAVAAGDAAAQEIAASDQRLAALAATSGLSPSNPQDLERLAAAAKLTALDRARLTPQTQEALARAEEAQTRLNDSDKRLSALAAAMRGGPSADDESRAGLIATLSSLTEFDLARATPEQSALVEQARSTAAQFAASDLARAAASTDVATAGPEELQRMSDLLSAARRYGAPPEPGSAAALAFAQADQAAARLAQSDRRLAAVREKAAQFEAGGPSVLDGEVLTIHDAVTAFDKARMTEADLRAFARLEQAREITLATQSRKLTRDVPIFLTAEAQDELTRLAVTELRRALSDDGFRLVGAMEQAAILMRVSRSEVETKSVMLMSSSVQTAEVDLKLSAQWTVSGETLTIPSAGGRALRGEPRLLGQEAIKDAAANAARGVAGLAER